MIVAHFAHSIDNGLARRFFRISKWIDAWQIASRHLYSESEDGIRTILTVCKWSCFGMFAFLEMFTIVSRGIQTISSEYQMTDVSLQTDALKLTATTWGPWVLREAYKFWFYAQAASILLSIYDLLLRWATVQSTIEMRSSNGKVKDSSKAAEQSVKSKGDMADTVSIFRRLLVDGCDILIPGSTVGWIDVDPLTVGVTGCISTAVSMRDIWVRIQRMNAG